MVFTDCTLELEARNLSSAALEGAAALFRDCHLQLPAPREAGQGLLVTLTRLNVAGTPGNCERGYLQFAAGPPLCGKLEEQPRTELYWPRVPAAGLPLHVHLASAPVLFSVTRRDVAACFNLTLSQQNATFSAPVSDELRCSLAVHVAWGFRVALGLELRPELNDVTDELGDNLWDEAPSQDNAEVRISSWRRNAAS